MADKGPLVVIGKETYSIAEIPASGTVLVSDQKKLLLGAVDLPALVTDLGNVGKFVRVAYNGVAGYTDLQIRIREIGYDVTKLCDKSAVTVAKFKQASGSILEDLQGTYQFLLDGLEDMAIDTLSAIGSVAKDMATAADELHREFDEESLRVEEALKETMRTKGSETQRKKDLEAAAKQYEVDKAKATQLKESAEEDFKFYEDKFKAAEKKEEFHEKQAMIKGLIGTVVSAVGTVAGGLGGMAAGGTAGGALNAEGDAESAKALRDEKIKHLEEMQKQREARRKALGDIAEFTKKIENCRDDSELAEVAIGALHKAVGGLQNLSATMMKAALFWKQMQVHCEQLASDKMQKMIATAMKRPEKDRIRVWTSTGFKTQAVAYYAKWVALDDVCAIYMKQIQDTQKDLYGYLTENPTLQQARVIVRDLAAKFGKELAMEQKAIAAKEFENERELKELKKAET